ncbi:MAG: hypothetical protein ABEJ85_00660 [Haloarculaceae archaeon]
MWVRSEYAGELAVLSAWLAPFVPWDVSLASGVAGGDLLFVRFPFLEVTYAYGVPLESGVRVLDPLSALALQRGTTAAVGYRAWVLAAAILLLALALAVGYYLREERVEAAPIDPVRALGALLAASGLSFGAAVYLLATNGLPALHVPIGALLFVALGATLLAVERTEEPAASDRI